MPKPAYGQVIVVNEGAGAGFPYTFPFFFESGSSSFRGQPIRLVEATVPLFRDSGVPTYGAQRVRVRNTRYGAPRFEDTSPA